MEHCSVLLPELSGSFGEVTAAPSSRLQAGVYNMV